MLFRAFIHNGRVNPANIPADTGYRHFCTKQRLFIVVAAHNNLPINQPAFLTRPPSPYAHFVAIPLGVDTGGQVSHTVRNGR
ncbi:Uncharacterised protein [Shigella sonnei]|nr:Uncharacterised protein [Shigella sonnei]